MKTVLLTLIFAGSCRSEPIGKLLVVSFDGFKSDFFGRTETPNLHDLMTTSAYRERVLNVFPTQTLPNHFSIATGLYAEEHGVLGSSLMEGGKILKFGYEMFHYNDDVVPIWTLNEMSKGGRRSGCYMWPGCGFKYRGIDTTYAMPFDQSVPWSDRIKTTIGWLSDPVKPANLVMLYFESPDFEEHIYGPNSNRTVEEIRKVDEAVGRIIAGLKAKNLSNVNVVVLSDHGMEAVSMARMINVTDILDHRGRAVGASPVLQIFPEFGKLDDLFLRLSVFSKTNKHFDVYQTRDIPERYRFKNCKRAPPILAVAKPGYALLDAELADWIKNITDTYKLKVTSDTEFGFHGYDPETPSMQPFLMATGPHFPKNFTLPERTVDLYGMFKKALRIGSPKDSSKVASSLPLQHTPEENVPVSVSLVFFSVASLIGLSTLFVVFIMFQRRHSARNMGYTLVDKEESGV